MFTSVETYRRLELYPVRANVNFVIRIRLGVGVWCSERSPRRRYASHMPVSEDLFGPSYEFFVSQSILRQTSNSSNYN